MVNYVVFPPKKNNIPHFLNQPYINSYFTTVHAGDLVAAVFRKFFSVIYAAKILKLFLHNKKR
jgi:hypothetical protein